MLIDSHCHLNFPGEVQPDAMIRRARAEGVDVLINGGDSLERSLAGLELAKAYEGVYCTLGVHPSEAETWDDRVEARFFEEISGNRDHAVGIGEIGLDYYRRGAPKDIQHEVFRVQIRLAKRVDLPVVVHCRDAFSDAIRILEEEGAERVDFHCYTGDLKTAYSLWEKGWVTSFSAVVSYPGSEALRTVVSECPGALYFLETDAPFLPHQEIRGLRNESMHLPKLARTIAEIRGESFETVSNVSSRNAIDFFGLRDVV